MTTKCNLAYRPHNVVYRVVMKQISQSEKIIMDVLWEQAPLAASDIAERVKSENWNIRTIKTLLSRLVQKNILQTKEDGRRYLYTPALSREDYGVRVLDKVSSQFFKDNAAPLFLHLAKSKNLSEDDIDEITALLKSLKSKASGDS